MQLPACLACPLLPSPPRGGAARSWTGGPAPLGSRVWPRDGPSTTVQTFRARAWGPRCWPLPTHTPGICCWTVQTPLLGCRPGPRSALPGDPAKLAARQADPDPFLACIPIGWGFTRQARPVGPDDLSPQSCVSGSARVGGQTSPDLLRSEVAGLGLGQADSRRLSTHSGTPCSVATQPELLQPPISAQSTGLACGPLLPLPLPLPPAGFPSEPPIYNHTKPCLFAFSAAPPGSDVFLCYLPAWLPLHAAFPAC